MTYLSKSIEICNKIEHYEAIFERGTDKDCEMTFNYNHGLNRVGKWGVVGGAVRIIYGSAQILGGLLLGVIFGVGALLSSSEGKYHEGNKTICKRSFIQAGHGILNIARGVGELIPGAAIVLFETNGHDDITQYQDEKTKRFKYPSEHTITPPSQYKRI